MDREQKTKIEPVLLSADDLKIYLSVGRSTAYRLLKSGEDFPTIRIGRRIMAKKEDVDAWLETKRVHKKEEAF